VYIVIPSISRILLELRTKNIVTENVVLYCTFRWTLDEICGSHVENFSGVSSRFVHNMNKMLHLLHADPTSRAWTSFSSGLQS